MSRLAADMRLPIRLEVALAIHATAVAAALQCRLFTIHLEMVRNFHRIAFIPWLRWAGAELAHDVERQSVIEVERDARVGVDLKFGSITFKQEDTGSFAVALIDVLVDVPGGTGTRVQMEIKVHADPAVDPILGVTETCRAHIIATLRAAADTFDATSARDLLFHG